MFAVGELVLKHRNISLMLDGLDTVAYVRLNNVWLLRARNMFQRFVLDVTHVIKVSLNSCRYH